METQINKLGKVAITVEPEDWDYNKDYNTNKFLMY